MALGSSLLLALATAPLCPLGTIVSMDMVETPPAAFPRLPDNIIFRSTRRLRAEATNCSVDLDYFHPNTSDSRFGPDRWAFFKGFRSVLASSASDPDRRYAEQFASEVSPCDAKAPLSSFMAGRNVCVAVRPRGRGTIVTFTPRYASRKPPTVVKLPYRYDSATPGMFLHVGAEIALGRREKGAPVVDILTFLLD